MTQHDVHPRHGFPPASDVAPALAALRGLPSPGAWVWLVTPTALETLVVNALVLFHVLPRLLVALGAQVGRHG